MSQEIDAQLGELRGRAEAPVHVGPAPRLGLRPAVGARGGLHHAPHHQLALRSQAGRLEPRLKGGLPRHLEERLDLGLVRPTAHQVRSSPTSQDQGQGVHQHRLSSPGLARHDIEPGRERQLQALDQDEISDA